MASVTALGMIETIGLVSAIEAADAGLKAAQVRLKGTINRDLRRSYEFYDVIASRIHSNGCGKFYRF